MTKKRPVRNGWVLLFSYNFTFFIQLANISIDSFSPAISKVNYTTVDVPLSKFMDYNMRMW